MLLKLWWKITGNALCLFVLHRVTSNVSLRVTLPLLAVSVGQVSAGADCDLQTGGVGVEGQSQLQFSGHRNALKAQLCAGAAAAALREPNTGYSINFTLQRKRMREVWERIIIRGDFVIGAVTFEYFNHRMLFGDFIQFFFFLMKISCDLLSSLQSTQNRMKSRPLPRWRSPPGRCLCFSWTGLEDLGLWRAAQRKKVVFFTLLLNFFIWYKTRKHQGAV